MPDHILGHYDYHPVPKGEGSLQRGPTDFPSEPGQSAPRLLLPSAGRKVALMHELERGFKVYPCGYAPPETASCCLAGRTRFVEQPRNLTDVAYVTWMTEVCKRIGIDVILPVRDGDMYRLDHMRELFDALKVKLVLSPTKTIAVANDKLHMYETLRGKLNVPVTFRYPDWEQLNVWPCFVKDRFGAGSVVARKVWTPEELGRIAIRHNNVVIQPWVGSNEYTIDAFFGWGGELHQAVVRKRVTTTEGQMDHGVVVLPHEALSRELLKLANALTFVGPINAQFIENHLSPGEFWLTDLNIRFGGGTPLSIHAGADFVRYLYQLVREEEITIGKVRLGTKAVSYLQYVYKEAW